MTDAEIVEALATKVMGWKRMTRRERIPDLYGVGQFDASVWDSVEQFEEQAAELEDHWFTEDGTDTHARAEKDHVMWEASEYQWNPLRDPAESKQVREKLAERFAVVELMHWRDMEPSCRCAVWNHDSDGYTRDTQLASADTEERAVAKCALLTVGVEP